MNLLEHIQQKPERQRRFLMTASMFALSFIILVIAWKSFERNLGLRLGDTAQENRSATPGPLQSLVEDVQRIAGGAEPVTQELEIRNNESEKGWFEKIFSAARKTKRVIKYNAGEMLKLFAEIRPWLVEVLW